MSTNSLLRGTSVAPSEAVVGRVANREGVDPLALDPLYGTLDTDALDALVRSVDGTGADCRVEFSYHGYDVTVTGEGVVHIEEPADAPRMAD